MRILVVSHPPLERRYGASQIALALAEGLGRRGHDAVPWTPGPPSRDTAWWNHWRAQRLALERFVASERPFDVIDAPALSLGPHLSRRGFRVARSVQPDLRYLRSSLRGQLRGHSLARGQWLLSALHMAQLAPAIRGAWQRANCILCLGTDEFSRMAESFPRWTPKLRRYVSALADDERPALAAVRASRQARAAGSGVRFLWLGRWSEHKGPRELLSFIRARLARHPLDSCTIAGCGEQAAAEITAQVPGNSRVAVVPSYSRAELCAILARHDVGLFTSHVEGWGLSLNEMLESGLPIYATDAGGVADLKPYFPTRIRAFPPPDSRDLGAPQAPAEAWNAYYAEFNWARIAERYEDEVLAMVAEAEMSG